MTLEALAARLLVFGFDGPSPTPEAEALLQAGAGGVILFKRNIEDAAQVFALNQALRALAPGPIHLSVDQEGGRVARLRGITTDLPPMRAVSTVDEAEAVGTLLGHELRALDFDLDMAPVVDVDTNPANPVIGDRAFSRDAEVVSKLGVALIRGMESAGLGACAKHFPGHGDTAIDSHLALPVLHHPLSRLQKVELAPFVAAAEAGVASMMTAHVVVTALDPELPATMSPAALGLLRDVIGYEGLLLSDDLEMGAIADNWGVAEAAVAAIGAGCDQVLVCHRPDRQWAVIEALVKAVEEGRLPRGRLEQAARRVEGFHKRFPPDRPRRPLSATLRKREALAFAAALGRPATGRDPTGDR